MPFTRPTTDIAKEGLFNVIQHQLDFTSLKSLDLFGGTGSISYELASRGVTDLTIVEKDALMCAFIKKKVEEFKIENCRVVKQEAFRFIDQCAEQFSFIFAGPPYAMQSIDDLPKKIFEKKLLMENGWMVLEHTPRNHYENLPFFVSSRNYGTTIFSIFVQTSSR